MPLESCLLIFYSIMVWQDKHACSRMSGSYAASAPKTPLALAFRQELQKPLRTSMRIPLQRRLLGVFMGSGSRPVYGHHGVILRRKGSLTSIVHVRVSILARPGKLYSELQHQSKNPAAARLDCDAPTRSQSRHSESLYEKPFEAAC